ncbi:hypothetical protein [Moraxella bovoculi]|uniref:hypothetical protein n=1 Tax=Moraxella bovoculi TaxID=386891 RepID=UPI000B0D1FC9|nr:hypothetical protein [Moraxella bovoculi]
MSALNSSKQIDTDVLIVGGDAVGVCLAIGLAKQQVVLIDIKPKLSAVDRQSMLAKRDARVYALNLLSLELFKDIGADDFVRRADYI